MSQTIDNDYGMTQVVILIARMVDSLGGGSASWTDNWSVIGPLVGVIAGGILGGVSQLIVAPRNNSYARRVRVGELRQQEYFQALDAVHAMRQAMRDLAFSTSGRFEPDESDQSDDAEDMRERDAIGALAVNAMLKARQDIEQAEMRVLAVGSGDVKDRMRKVMEAADRLVEGDESEDPSLFSASHANETFEVFAKATDSLIREMREDLEVDQVYRTKGLR